MENQQELGGAQALLQLGSKSKNDDDKDDEKVDDKDDELESESKATNQQINDAVEAAVMRYVGGTLDNEDSKKNKKRLNPDELISSISDFQQWTGFLDDNIDNNNNNQPQANNELVDVGTPPKKKKKRSSSSQNDIDPELTGLDSNSEHDQLVRAAILETRELAKQLGSAYNSLSNLPPQQAQQVLLAMQNQSQADSITNINHLAQLSYQDKSKLKKPLKNFTTTTGSTTTTNTMTNDQSGYKDPNHDITKSQGDNSITDDITSATDSIKQELRDTIPTNYDHINNIETLANEAQKISNAWYNSLPNNDVKGPRPFSPEEQRAVEYFIDGYSYLYNIDRQGVCNRIWSNERKKDNFWECLTRVMPYRSRASVYKHVRRQYHVFDVRAKWTPEDDNTLRKLAATKEGNWRDIGQVMGRMPEDCRDRWRNYVKCGENRLLSRWSGEEERKLKEIVTELLTKLKLNTINWTIVSEKMDGTRSRIQCRYKWNKLVKRESINRSSYMSLDTKLWLFQKLQKLNYNSIDEVDWSFVTKLYYDENKQNSETPWLPSDFEFGFEKMKSIIKDHKILPFSHLLNKLIEEILTKQSETGTSTTATATTTTDNDPTSIANAAVAANDERSGEYIWR